MSIFVLKFFLLFILVVQKTTCYDNWNERNCSSLRIGQYRCAIPKIDPLKQNKINCTKEGFIKIACYPAKNIICENKIFNGNTVGFHQRLKCRHVTNYNYQTTVLLSIFFGIFGIDRIYLGYYSIGVVKACTFGYMFIGYLIEMLLIITQNLGPADGSKYLIDYYGQILYSYTLSNNKTLRFSYSL